MQGLLCLKPIRTGKIRKIEQSKKKCVFPSQLACYEQSLAQAVLKQDPPYETESGLSIFMIHSDQRYHKLLYTNMVKKEQDFWRWKHPSSSNLGNPTLQCQFPFPSIKFIYADPLLFFIQWPKIMAPNQNVEKEISDKKETLFQLFI